MLGVVINVVTERVTMIGPRGRFGPYSAMFLGVGAYERPYSTGYTMGLIIRRSCVQITQGPLGKSQDQRGDKAGNAFPSQRGASPVFSRPFTAETRRWLDSARWGGI